ncbi:MAG: hypothetical protein MJ178_07660, partial [Treponemataceae bacterium]|nr:hypothetical protein [Treponemataceae bacterium]
IRKCVVSEAAGSPVEYREDYQYTNGGRTITVTRGGEYAAVYQLNAFGEITAATDGEGNTTTYRVTPQGLQKSVTLPLGNTTSFTYDCLGNVTQLIQPDGSTVTFQYNALGTLLCTTDGTGTPHYPEVSVANEPADSLRDTTGLTYDRNGNLIDAVSGTNHLTFTWNQAGLLTQQKDVQRGITTSWTYDKAGRPETAITRQQGKEISALHYQWDANGNLISLRDTAQNLSVTCAYDVMNREVEKRYGNGTVCRTRYDAAGRKTALWTTSSQGDIIAAEAMVYDPDTGRKAASFTREGMLILYSYDQQGHLCRIQKTATPEEVLSAKARIQVIPAATVKALRSAISQAHPSLGSRIPSTVALVTETYTFDERGNRILRETPAGTTQYSYDDRDRLTAVRQVEKGTVETFVWDDRGNLTEKRASGRTDRYHYDRKNRLVQVEITTGSGKATQTQCITYDYDALGRRYSTTTNGTTVLSVYNGVSFAVTAELFDLPDTPQYRYRWSEDTGKETGSRTRLFINGAPAAERRGTATAYLAEDSTGSVVLETDQYGRITASRSYDVFGTTISSEILQYR